MWVYDKKEKKNYIIKRMWVRRIVMDELGVVIIYRVYNLYELR